MLKLELSKQLKDKGFPQGFQVPDQDDLYQEYWCSLDGAEPVVIFLSSKEYRDGFLTTTKGTWLPIARVPQVYELVEFCDKIQHFHSIYKVPKKEGSGLEYVAAGLKDLNFDDPIKERGETMEEALANLILKLI